MAAGALILAWPAFYNGYPLHWFDSLGYLLPAWMGGYAPQIRSPFYSLAITPLVKLNSEWPIVFAQTAIVAAMILLVLRTLSGRLRALEYLLVIGLLALLTGLPWHGSFIMTDVLAGVVPLGFFLLAFMRDRLAWWEFSIAFAITCFASLVHYSHLPLALALVIVVAGILLIERRPRGEVLRGAGCCLAVLAVAIVGQVSVQWIFNGRPAISASGPVFLLARLVEDGPAKDYLSAHCAQEKFALCAFVDEMPMSTTRFLWAGDGPVQRLGGFKAVSGEASIIVDGTLRDRPLQFVWLSLGHALRQFVEFGMENYVGSYDDHDQEWQKTIEMMKDRLPGELEAFTKSRQAAGQVGLHGFFQLQRVMVIISGALLLSLYFGCDRRLRELMWVVAAALVANAAVCGALSGPSDRYQSRLIWLLPFLLFLVALSALNGWRSRRAAT